MGFITKSRLEDIAGKYTAKDNAITKSILVENYLRSDKAKTSVFLSHCHQDKLEVEQAVVLLAKYDTAAYIDWLDDDMPKHTNFETAKKLKQKIQSCRKFILLATDNAIQSKWCNWELGYGDSTKNNNVVLLPIAASNLSWSGNEYLQIYPWIEERNGDYEIYFPTHTGTRSCLLCEWLERS